MLTSNTAAPKRYNGWISRGYVAAKSHYLTNIANGGPLQSATSLCGKATYHRVGFISLLGDHSAVGSGGACQECARLRDAARGESAADADAFYGDLLRD